jgi:hypothetical protein
MNSPKRRTRPRGFASWNPQPASLELIEQVKSVLVEYEAHLPLTCRQIFYRLVGTAGYDKTELAYSRLCEAIGRARRAGFIGFSAIRDDGSARYQDETWSDPAHFLADMCDSARNFQIDRQHSQTVRLWVICEAGGMAPMLARTAASFGVPVLTSGGFDSLTAKHDLAQELAGASEAAEVLHIGDHDPSGVHLFSALEADVSAMVQAISGAVPIFTRLAVTPEQAELFDLPLAPPKKTDRRSFSGQTVQAEALPPDVLADILREAIKCRQSPSVFSDVLAAESDMRADLIQSLEDLA